MRDELKSLIDTFFCCVDIDKFYIQDQKEKLTDYLLENGVIVPPCKVGDTVWYLNKHPHIALLQNSVYKAKVVRIITTSLGTSIVIQIKSEGCCEIPDIYEWGETLFATREEAEKALKEGAE